MISNPTAISMMTGVLHFMAISTGPVLNYRTLSPPLGPVNFAARHRALPSRSTSPERIAMRIRSAVSAVIRVEVFEREIDPLIGTG